MTHAQAHQRRLLVVDWNRGGWCAWVRRAEEVISPLKADVIAYARRHGYNGVAEVVAIDYYVDADGYTHGYEIQRWT